ncbi:TIGR01666 family membrane protein [Vespertiliibacter pulmonis]|uniref:Putative membrane protein (TIGR01666 family) n=1 Tax=Vespertiliibacter pulmonis TaxID=1443036 RepID=A0A3N4VIB7_9PAST|nr:YccS family putative transporter [Vespertiliibacter pulmonis]QLB20656.1 TIGR01666 family membrane protein [Vespertiliibacter pulmonis]RPE82792.1 putative membrane protein (TIGR01666 family) [Vespertiliibacter pulmonis]
MHNLLKKLSFEWLNANILGILPIFLATNIAAITVWQLHISEHTMPLVLGIIAGGLSDLDNRLTGRLKNLLFSLIAFGISALSAQLALSFNWLFIPLITTITFIVIMLGAIGPRYSTIAFSTLLVAVYITLTYTENSVWYSNPLLIVCGTLLYGICAVLVYLLFPNRTMQENVAQYFSSLGHYLQIKASFFDPDDPDSLPEKQFALAQANIEVLNAFDKARISLFYRLNNQHRNRFTQRMLRFYFTGQDIWEQASSSYTSHYLELFQSLQNTDLVFRFHRLLELQATACQQIAHSLRHNEPYQYPIQRTRVLMGLNQSLTFYQEKGIKYFSKLHSIAENLRYIEGQLVQLANNSPNEPPQNLPKTVHLIAENASTFRNIIHAVRSQCHFGSQLFRHAIRLSIVVFICSLFAELFQITQGYWILLTAILVCQPNYSATKKRLIQRVIGTILGVIVGLSLRYISPTLEAQLGLLVASSSLFFLFRTNNYSFSTFFITLQVLISFDIVGLDPDGAMLPRIIDTLIGAGIAWLAVSYLWPDWKYINLRQSLTETLASNADYLKQIIAQLQFGYRHQFSYRVARRSAQNAVANLSTTVANMLAEPKKYQKALGNAPSLLGLSYTLISYISALGTYRSESHLLNQQIDFSGIFFKQAKQVVQLLEKIAKDKGDQREILLAEIDNTDQQLRQIEMEHQLSIDEKSLVLLQQLHLIVQLLPQFYGLIDTENTLQVPQKN